MSLVDFGIFEGAARQRRDGHARLRVHERAHFGREAFAHIGGNRGGSEQDGGHDENAAGREGFG